MNGSETIRKARSVWPGRSRMNALLVTAGVTLVGAMTLAIVQLMPEQPLRAAVAGTELSPAVLGELAVQADGASDTHGAWAEAARAEAEAAVAGTAQPVSAGGGQAAAGAGAGGAATAASLAGSAAAEAADAGDAGQAASGPNGAAGGGGAPAREGPASAQAGAAGASEPTAASDDAAVFSSVEGLTLSDRYEQVVAKKGMPYDVQKDPEPGLYTYRYPSMDVGFMDGEVWYVSVPVEVGSLDINGKRVALTLEALRERLGEPDYTAEDGLVYQRRETLIKLFVDPTTKELLSVSYYHITSA
ncbi:hypothetical protein B5M42_020635 [Paenibacillus athensensis]|uniref:Uncharacterized protein n=1 Tax=Paenibacillus athensensis TaxID=1967502 RepID=A0A4Y8PZH0_9BACL|nr:hypothetical protein [Paenibacillus athensensis]MCD1261210.1 hypothetical protein [Paenibacillus athensensis]